MTALHTFSTNNFHDICDNLAARDPDLAHIIETYGYPPFWDRPNTYETLVQIILEQQVSLASAKATLEKLRSKINYITPENVITLTDEELRACYFSRQKTSYVRALTKEILAGHLVISELESMPDDKIRQKLIQLKGIGHWTVDVYLILVLHRMDFFPFGDIAAVNALKQLKKLPKDTPHEVLLNIVGNWQPYRTAATMLLWHHYLSLRGRVIA